MNAEVDEILNIFELHKASMSELLTLASNLNISGASKLRKPELVYAIYSTEAARGKRLVGGGIVDILNSNNAYARCESSNCVPNPTDIYIHGKLIAKYELKQGQHVTGEVVLSEDGKKAQLNSVSAINQVDVKSRKKSIDFEELTPDFPREQIKLESNDPGSDSVSLRIIDLMFPIGFGQRALIVAPPKSGKTVLLKEIASAISKNYPDSKLVMLLIDERPEEVTAAKRAVHGEVISSNFDEAPENHIKVAEMALSRAKRAAESGKDVVILLDSITRLARAYNTVIPASGKVLTGGIDMHALNKPKHFFGAARNLEGSGSLTIIATALVETGSKMDEIIFEEFRGRGNSDIILKRKIAEAGIFPAIDMSLSGTRMPGLMRGFNEKLSTAVRRSLMREDPLNALKSIIEKLKITPTNQDFIAMLQRGR
jgi:transcription termination factor Rho